jgi:hypothetical protein
VAQTPKLAYVQTRIQARCGERLDDADWRSLEAVRSAAQFLDLARNTSLAPWADRLSAEMALHTIERRLRAAWRETVEEIATWLPERWQKPIRSLAILPELPVRDHSARGYGSPSWLEGDDTFGGAALSSGEESGDAASSVGAEWLAGWREFRPSLSAGEAGALDKLIGTLFANFNTAYRDTPTSRYRPSRTVIEAVCFRVFRRHAGSPVAALAYLLLVMLDFERFRGGLLKRVLFGPSAERSAA